MASIDLNFSMQFTATFNQLALLSLLVTMRSFVSDGDRRCRRQRREARLFTA